jgi:hypothetical protein
MLHANYTSFNSIYAYVLCHQSGKRSPVNAITSQQLAIAVNKGTLFAHQYPNTWSLVKSTVSSCTTHYNTSTSHSDSDTSEDSSNDSGEEQTDVDYDEDNTDRKSEYSLSILTTSSLNCT